jgi:hypothetical protein
LQSICIPSGVEVLGSWAFLSCLELSNVSFEFRSRLIRIERGAFAACEDLQSICLPPDLEFLECEALPWSSLEYLS